MVYRLPNLLWLRAFESSARLCSFTAAARELGLTQAAVSHQVRSLEGKLGFRLFQRNARSLALTEMGRAYLPAVRKAMEDLAFSTQGLFGAPGRRTISVRAPISTAVLWLAPRLPAFRERHPGIRLRLISAIWADAIADEDVDVDIRLGEGAWAGMQAELLARDVMVPVCSPAIARRVRRLGDVDQAQIVQVLGFQDHWARLYGAEGLAYDPARVGLAVDTTLAAVEIVTMGAGVALLQRRLVQGLIAEGRLAVPFAAEVPLEQAHYLVSAPGAAPNTEADAFRAWLRGEFGEAAVA